MNPFPAADPIPLPAPVWLFKVLNDLTLALHLSAVELLLGGLMLGLAFAVLGRLQNRRNMAEAGGMIAHRLPTVMAFLINLGVPPLLFAQVLYGRALYTSSVLIGAYWIAVILLLMLSYYGLYFAAGQANARRSWAAPGFAALILVLTIAFIYTNNMSLMLRPHAWAEMYRHSPAGVQWNTSDPTLWPRWLFFVLGSLSGAGAALMLLSLRAHFDPGLRAFLFRAGAIAMIAGLAAQSIAGPVAFSAVAPDLKSALLSDATCRSFAFLWMAMVVTGLLAGIAAVFAAGLRSVLAPASALAMFLNVASVVMVRDGFRDVTLRAAGFDVWDRHVVTNWTVVAIFLLLFVSALAVVGYLIRVVSRARRIEETYV